MKKEKILKSFLKILLYYSKKTKKISEYLNVRSRQYISTNITKLLINERKLEYSNKNSVNDKKSKACNSYRQKQLI